MTEVEYRWHDRTPQQRPEAPEGHTLGRVVRVRGTLDAMLRGLWWPVGCMLYVEGEPLFTPGQRWTVHSREGR